MSPELKSMIHPWTMVQESGKWRITNGVVYYLCSDKSDAEYIFEGLTKQSTHTTR